MTEPAAWRHQRNSPVNRRALAGLLIIALTLLGVALSRLQLTYDLGFFLPPPQSDEQRLLIERLGQGPGTQLLFVVLPGSDEATSVAAAARLRSVSGVARVLPEPVELGIDTMPAALWQNRLLLDDLPATIEGWLDVLDERMGDVMLGDAELSSLITQDPALLSISALEKATSSVSQPKFWQPADLANGLAAQRFLLIQTTTGAFDLDSQAQTVHSVRESLQAAGLHDAMLYGSGVYGVDLQASVQRESIVFSALASLALAVLVFLRFRTPLLVLAVAIPLVVGGLAGLAVLAVVFSEVHGITLAFGFTLLGVAIDYPLHLFSDRTQQPTRRTNSSSGVWPTLRLGIASTLVAYLAFALSGTTGMQQLGVFATTGIACAALASWWLTHDSQVPESNPPPKTIPATIPTSTAFMGTPNHLPWFLCVLLGTPFLYSTDLFSNDLSRLTPVPKATLEEDARIRKAMGVADLRYLVSVRRDTLEETLQHLEDVGLLLTRSVDRGELTGFQNISALLPSKAMQQQRRVAARRLVDAGIFQKALEQSDFEPEAFQNFTAELSTFAANTPPAFELTNLKSGADELSSLIDTMLYQTNAEWVALTFLRGLPDDTQLIDNQLQTLDGVHLVDLKQASMTLVADYRTRIFALLGISLGVIALFLLATTRQPARVVWLLGTLCAALVVSVGVSRLLLGGLSLFDAIALALVAGLGLDYALFFSKQSDDTQDQKNTQRAVLLCALSSFFVFGVLGLSNVPLLRGLGVTVACGVAAAWLLARIGWRRETLTE